MLARMTAHPPAAGVLDVVLDTDVTNEVDDQFALVWALLRPDRLNVVGLHACPYGLSPQLFRPGGGLLTELDRRHLERELTALGLTADDVPVLSPADGAQRAYDELLRFRELAGGTSPSPAAPTATCPTRGRRWRARRPTGSSSWRTHRARVGCTSSRSAA